MPFAIYSKRTNVVKRIVHTLGTVLPSEGFIELDETYSFPRRYDTTLIGQTVNTLGVRQFDVGSGEQATDPLAEDGSAREPLLSQYSATVGRVEMPLHAVPLSWTSTDLIQAKYEAILAKNRPYHVVVGEEFIDLDHINDTNSSDYLLARGKGIILPTGNIETKEFKFYIPLTDQGAQPSDRPDYNLFKFDSLFLKINPAQDLGLTIKYDTGASGGALSGSWTDVNLNAPIALGADKTSIALDFINNSNHPISLENYMLFIGLRGLN